MNCTEKFTGFENSALSNQIQRSFKRLREHRLITASLVSLNIPLDSLNFRTRQHNRSRVRIDSLSQTKNKIREAALISVLRREASESINLASI
jgi:hypothetical protein